MLNDAMAILAAAPEGEYNPLRVTEFPPSTTPIEAWALQALFVSADVLTVGLFLGICVCLWRMMKGPTVVDRGIASDTLSLQVIGLAIALSIRMSTLVSFDVVIIIAILGFVSTLTFAQYVGRKGTVAS